MIKNRVIRKNDKTEGEYSESKDQIARKRTKRTPLGRRVQKMTAPQEKGFYYHWINDNGDRLSRAKNAGYEFVLRDKEKVSVKVDSENSSKKAYLMRLPNEFREEDLLKKREDVEATLGRIQKYKDDVESNYIPSEEGKTTLSDAQIEKLVNKKVEEIMRKKSQ